MVYDRNNPFLSTIIERKVLTATHSLKNTQHVSLSIAGSGYTYVPGDSVGVYAQNDPAEVDALLNAYDLDPYTSVVVPKKEPMVQPLREVIMRECSLVAPTREGLAALAELTSSAEERASLQALLVPEAAEAFKKYVSERDWLDLVSEFPNARLDAHTLVRCLRRLMPRLYSIACSQTLYPQEVHLTVAVVAFFARGRLRKGIASGFLTERIAIGEASVPVFMGRSTFHLPEDDNLDIIMIGPGTGVAPYRGFVQERVARAAKGRNWLFFGEHRHETDFLYGDEWKRYQKEGHIHRLSLAFSRDQEHKIYVQHRLQEEAEEVWRWIESGACIYLCGDAQNMAPGVEKTLLEIIGQQGKMSPEAAVDFFKNMRKAKKYFKDVY
jgi:sulfite reductase (NADPH) flavoprotein alpha-component